jgi:hypothetical protein
VSARARRRLALACALFAPVLLASGIADHDWWLVALAPVMLINAALVWRETH